MADARAIRIPERQVERAEKLQDIYNKFAAPPEWSLSDVVRSALSRGLDLLEAEEADRQSSEPTRKAQNRVKDERDERIRKMPRRSR